MKKAFINSYRYHAIKFSCPKTLVWKSFKVTIQITVPGGVMSTTLLSTPPEFSDLPTALRPRSGREVI